MIVSVNITYAGAVGRILRREWNGILKNAWAAVGRYWHTMYRPKHFTHAGATEYGYEKRKSRYERRKLRRYGHTYPLVFSGMSRNLARLQDVRPYATGGNSPTGKSGVRIVLHSPGLNRRPKTGTINMRDEMTRVSRREMRELLSICSHRVQNGLDGLRGVREKVAI